MSDPLINTNIAGHSLLPTPGQVRESLPASPASLEAVARGRRQIRDILDRRDRRLLLVVGPCSIHDPEAALEYAERLAGLARRVEDRFLVAMRVYFEKPRTTVGWKGLINDPFMNDSFHIERGLRLARRLLLRVTRMGLFTASEALDPITPQYLGELVCWHAIGARTIESQTHREMASGLSSPVGFKNGTDGNVQVAIDAMRSALAPHHFLGIDPRGRISVFRTRGNPHSHVVLRGGRAPNYDAASVARCRRALEAAGLPPRIMIDCSHGNSGKDHRRQPAVFEACLEQARAGDSSLIGMMVESHLKAGNQPIPKDLRRLRRGVSVTDKCLGWAETERMVLRAYRRTRR
ncbi:MAG: 3-deoxy-7-phosphoheptulonate synthase [Elusimicrobia bacterium]|nr:3-deoxy-7-phosphoheptulonate synthase [Elusimicrobiota bacterium]